MPPASPDRKGVAAHHSKGSSVAPLCESASIAPAIEVFVPRNRVNSGSPRVSGVRSPGDTKSASVVGFAWNVLVSCMKPPTAMRRPAAWCTNMVQASHKGAGA